MPGRDFCGEHTGLGKPGALSTCAGPTSGVLEQSRKSLQLNSKGVLAIEEILEQGSRREDRTGSVSRGQLSPPEKGGSPHGLPTAPMPVTHTHSLSVLQSWRAAVFGSHLGAGLSRLRWGSSLARQCFNMKDKLTA